MVLRIRHPSSSLKLPPHLAGTGFTPPMLGEWGGLHDGISVSPVLLELLQLDQPFFSNYCGRGMKDNLEAYAQFGQPISLYPAP